MMYSYKAYNENYSVIEDIIEASDEGEAISIIQSKGLFLIELRQLKEKKRQHISDEELLSFTRVLSTLSSADIPIVKGLQITLSQIQNEEFKDVIKRIIFLLKNGSSLSQAMSGFKGIFDNLYISLIKAGEISGKLSEVLSQLYIYIERKIMLKKQVKGAMIYPTIVFIVAILIISLFLTVLIPSFRENFSNLGIPIHPITRLLFNVSDFYKENLHFIIFGVGFLILSVYLFIKKSQVGRKWRDSVVFVLPLFGELSHFSLLTRFARTMAIMIDSGVPILDAFSVARLVVDNYFFEQLLVSAQKKIAAGEGIANVLSSSRYIPQIFIQMLSIGEESGRIGEMFANIADYYDQEVKLAVDKITSIISPVLIIFLGIFVGFIVVSLFLPIFSAAGSMGG